VSVNDQPPKDLAALGRWVVELCRAKGFALAGVCRAEPTRFAAELDAWLAAGRHGSMDYLATQAEIRKNPALELPDVRSVIMVADQYADGSAEDPVPPGAGRVARYARGRDYHWFVKRRLHHLADALRPHWPGESFRTFVDTAPVLEREHAARAGLGWVGKHTLIIHPERGSYLLLGGIFTTLEIAAGHPEVPIADACGSCTRCIDACPTAAISPYSVDASRCIAYLTIEHRGLIDPAFHSAMGDWIFGCDICQEVCPHNRPAGAAERPANPEYRPRFGPLPIEDVLSWDDRSRTAALSGTAIKRARLEMLKRNALIALGNAASRLGEAAVADRLARVIEDNAESPMVRETARQVLAGLKQAGR